MYFGGFKHFCIFTPKIGEDFQFDDHIFQRGWNHQPVYHGIEAFVNVI